MLSVCLMHIKHLLCKRNSAGCQTIKLSSDILSKARPANFQFQHYLCASNATGTECWTLVLCRMSWYLPGVDELHTLQPCGEEGLWAQSTLTPVRQHVLQLWVRWKISGHHWQLISVLLEDQPGWELLNTLNYNQQRRGKVIVKTNHFKILMT